MNNFELPAEELFAGPMRWFGANSSSVAHLDPLKRQIGLTGSWPQWMEYETDSRAFRAVSALEELLIPKVVNELNSAEFSDIAFTLVFSGVHAIKDWLGSEVEADAKLRLNAEGMQRWALIGVSRNLAVGAIAIQTEWPPVGYSVDSSTKTMVHISPLNQSSASSVVHLSPSE